MPEPITLVAGGVLLYGLLRGRGAPPSNPPGLAAAPAQETAGGAPLAAIPPGALATNTSVANQQTAPLAAAGDAIVVPSDLVSVLDNDAALKMRAYAALNPDDFQAFLGRYADRIVLRNDMYLEALTGPPERGYELSPAMAAGLGSAAYKVVQALNGVYVGRSVDIFGVSASVAGQIPGVNPDLVAGLQAAAMSYRAITGIADIATVVAAFPNVSFFELGGMVAGGVTAYPGLAALPFAGVLMAVGLVVDIGFTIIGDKPDLQKAVDVALDVASLAVLFIPVIGIVIAIVIQLVKFIIDLFGEDLFGGGMSEEQQDMIEAAKYGEKLNPMFPVLASAYTPRELYRTIIEWTVGYNPAFPGGHCGGQHDVAMSVNVVLNPGDRLLVGGQWYTVPPVAPDQVGGAPLYGSPDVTPILGMTLLGVAAPGCYNYQGTAYQNITADEIATAVAVYAPVNGVVAKALVGVREWLKEQFDTPTEDLIATRAVPMREFIVKHRLTLDQIDQVALEYRAQPHLNELASAFGWPTWQELFASTVAEEWAAYTWAHAEGSLSEFARLNGHQTMYAFRAAALRPFEDVWARAQEGFRVAQATLVKYDLLYQQVVGGLFATQSAP